MTYWDDRHRNSSGDLTPEPLLVLAAQDVPPGRALDLACGTGRNALWLAQRGWDVTAVDSSPVALEMLRTQAALRGLSIDARLADLERHEYAIQPHAWDLIVMIRYLQRDLFEPVKSGVVAGGVALAMALLADAEHTRFRMDAGELRGYFAGWEILHDKEAAFAEILARKIRSQESGARMKTFRLSFKLRTARYLKRRTTV